MRVIAGEKRHLLLKTLDSLDIRPTTDKIKETLFNIIQWDITDCKFLDLFAGSGAIGIEALSRGAKNATFVDNNIEAIKVIKENLEHTGLTDKSKVIKMDAIDEVYKLGNNGVIYDIIFIDPPYDNVDIYKKIVYAIKEAKIYNNTTIIVVEADKNFDNKIFEDNGYTIVKEKIYKNNKHVFMKVL